MTEAALPRVGIIGAGGIGKTHLRTWAANGISPTAIADAKAEILDAAIVDHGGQPYASGFDLIASGTIDIVSICTPPAFHADLAIAAAEAGLAILCEKPLATTVADAERVAEAVERTGALFAMGFCHRFQPEIEALKGLIEAGELGTIREVRNRFAGHLKNVEQTWFANPKIAGGGVLVDTSVHSIDIFRYLVGDVVGVHALTSTRETELGPTLDVEDTGVLILQSADGVLGVIESSWRTPPGEWALSVHGTGGTAVVDYVAMTLRVQGLDGAWRNLDVGEGDRFVREIAAFIACWRGEETPRATLADGVAATRILAAAYRSAAIPTGVG
jgi:predicted dehydrogenase